MAFVHDASLGRRLFVLVALLATTLEPSARADERAVLKSDDLRLEFAGGSGVVLDRLVNEKTGDDALKTGGPARLLVVTVGDVQVDARDFDGRLAIERREGRETVRWTGRCERLGLVARVTVESLGGGESLWSLEVENAGAVSTTFKTAFPVLDGMQIGGDLAADRYFHGLNGGSMGDRPIDFRAMYGYSLPVMDVYDDAGGVSLRVQDVSNAHKVLDLVKRPAIGEEPRRFHDVAGSGRSHTAVLKGVGVGMAVQHLERNLAPGARFAFPPSVVAVHQGDWRAGMDAYRRWLLSWYRRQAPRPDWFRGVFAHKALHQSHFHPESSYVRSWLQPGDDMVDVNHWMAGRGDYRVREDWGGAEPLKREIQAWREQGVRTSLYLEAVCVDREIPIGKAHGGDWSVLQKGERAVSEGDREWNFCPGAVGWQDYLAETCARLLRETDCDSIYPDSVGLRYSMCEDPGHDHPVGEGWYGSVERLLKKVRSACDAVNPDAVLYLEYISSDVNTQYLDGCYSPCVNASLEMRAKGLDLYPTGTNLFRFYFPDFKFIEIAPETREGVGLALFNGNGIHGYLNQPEIRPYVEKLSGIYHEYGDAFRSDRPIPYVATLRPGLFCHAFPGKNRTVYTVFNTLDAPLEGELLKNPPEAGPAFRELIREAPVSAAPGEGGATLSFRIEPREVLCIVSDR